MSILAFHLPVMERQLSELCAARLALKPTRLNDEDILAWLSLQPFPDRGRSVNSSGTRGFTLGSVRMGPFCHVSKHTKKYPAAVRFLVRIANDFGIDVPYTAIQLNRGINTSPSKAAFQIPHVDRNCAPGYLQSLGAFGHFEGGDIAVCHHAEHQLAILCPCSRRPRFCA
jgi:hypothetical protein